MSDQSDTYTLLSGRTTNNHLWFKRFGAPIVRIGWAAALDILGFKNKIIAAHAANKSNAELQHFVQALKRGRHKLRFDSGVHPWFLRTYSDNVLLASPLYDDGETAWYETIMAVAAFQASMLFDGYFIRGGLSCSDIHVGPSALYGAALVDAHQAEKHLANWPRVVLGASALAIVCDHISYTGGISEDHDTPYEFELLEDQDSLLWFVDYIRLALVDRDGRLSRSAVERHRDIIQDAFERYKNSFTVRQNIVIWHLTTISYVTRSVGEMLAAESGAFRNDRAV